MSETEINRGRLVPDIRLPAAIAEVVVLSVPKWAASKVDAFTDDPANYGYEYINNVYYKLEDHSCEDDTDDICELNLNTDNGEITFMTKHYNGGGHWTELIESKLKENSND
jgi:hypothetical protein